MSKVAEPAKRGAVQGTAGDGGHSVGASWQGGAATKYLRPSSMTGARRGSSVLVDLVSPDATVLRPV